ncbi:hypothetical protein FRC12_018499 [Ceratobasidium sp. 428]|nr:hypothetical protein FRC12_018499 [Ceratobasidium sp. 428]
MKHDGDNSHMPEVVLKPLPATLPITAKTAMVTGIETYASASHSAYRTSEDIAQVSGSLPAVDSLAVEPHTPTKRKNVYLVSAFCSLGGFLFGADTGSIGSITSMPQFIQVFPTLRNEAVLGALVATV